MKLTPVVFCFASFWFILVSYPESETIVLEEKALQNWTNNNK